MPSSSVPELQQKLFKRFGFDAPPQTSGTGANKRRAGSGSQLSRKEQRKVQRQGRKQNLYSAKQQQPKARTTKTNPQLIPKLPSRPEETRNTSLSARHSEIDNLHEPEKDYSNGHGNRKPGTESGDSEEDLEEDPSDFDEGDLMQDDRDEDESDEEDETASEEYDDEDGDEDEGKDRSGKEYESEKEEGTIRDQGLSRNMKLKLAQDDAEISAFERKLGIKKGRKSLPQAFRDDGLDILMGDLAEASEGSDDDSKKRKRDYDDWLSSKRQRANRVDSEYDDEDQLFSDSGESENAESDDESLEEGQGKKAPTGRNSDAQVLQSKSRQKENPYVAPTTGTVVAKYIPPSLRKHAVSEDEAKSRLRKQIQGLINRLTDANLLSIVQSVDEIYSQNARGDVTEVLTDTILAQVCKPESLPDQFFVLTGGFAAAVYRIIGASFGGHIVRKFVEEFGQHYKKASETRGDEVSAIPKEASNLLTFVSQLYLFEVISCKIVFDYMELLLSHHSEINVELLLRICRMTGRLLRRDDPLALKHITSVLNKKVAELGPSAISARTKFMIELINDLKNSKPKAKGLDSAIVSEHVIRTKKRLGDLKSQSRRLDGLAPMGMSLKDVEGADTHGKWWLVGASVPVKPDGPNTAKGKSATGRVDEAELVDDEDMDYVLPNYPNMARSQGLGTNTQIAIFTSIMSATNYEHGYRQFMGLGLKKDDQLEIAKVLVQCVGSESPYNPYYALIGKQACANSRIRFAFQDRLWKIFRGLGESLFGEEIEDEDTAESERMRNKDRIGAVAKLYASLIADGSLSLSILKPLNLLEANSWTVTFVEVVIIGILEECRAGKEAREDKRIEKVFGGLRGYPVLAAGIGSFLKKKISRTKVIDSRALKKLERVRTKAELMIEAAQIAE